MDFNKPRVSRDRARHLANERQKQAQGAALAAACVFVVMLIPIQAFILMLVMGAVHGAFIAVPAIGYGTSVLFVLGADLIVGFVRRLFRK
ncbi:hypothetical protein ACFUEM_08615 [Streptomyces anulatus]|uniref:hypothetical protein n=1 Tax=Streptomyces anulatus TaxID=1892 RepID=UPI0035E0653E